MQLSFYEEVVAVLDGLKDPTLIFARIKNEIEVDKIDQATSLKNYLHYKKEVREVAKENSSKRSAKKNSVKNLE